MFGDSILSRTSKSVRNKKVIKEEWNKKRITKKEKPSYQIGSSKSETIKIKKSTKRKKANKDTSGKSYSNENDTDAKEIQVKENENPFQIEENESNNQTIFFVLLALIK